MIVEIALAIGLLRAGWRPGPRTGAALVAIFLCMMGKMVVTPFDETRFHLAYLVSDGLLLLEGLAIMSRQARSDVFGAPVRSQILKLLQVRRE